MYLRFISVLDCLCLLWLSVGLVLEMTPSASQHNHDIICKLLIFPYLCFLNTNSHLVCAMGMERLYAVFRPISYREKVKISTNKKASLSCMMVASLLACAGLPFMGNDGGFCLSVNKDANKVIAQLVVVVVGFINYVVPTIAISIINAVLIVQLKIIASRRRYIFRIVIFNLAQVLGRKLH